MALGRVRYCGSSKRPVSARPSRGVCCVGVLVGIEAPPPNSETGRRGRSRREEGE